MNRVSEITETFAGAVTHGFVHTAGSRVTFHYDCDECRRIAAADDDRQLGLAVCDDSPETPPGG